MTPDEFVTRWRDTTLNERQSYQMHFADLCRLLGHDTPTGTGQDEHGLRFEFEAGVKKDGGSHGFADVFYENHFAIEYKAPGKYPDLHAAYQQLLQYREKLNNPPLLVVTDIAQWEIHTNWPNTEKRVYRFKHDEIGTLSVVRDRLHHLFYAPERLHPQRNTEEVTADAARVFQVIADNMRDWAAEPDRIAHFLTKLVFCLFAEDVNLLPVGPRGDVGIFSEIVERTRTEPQKFVYYAESLFKAMADGGEVLFANIPYFNGTLFEDVQVEDLSLEALTGLERASKLNWESVEPAIFGTLFERSLDPSKRAQLGAHYTSREDIMLIVEPVLMQPLRREWDAIQTEAAPIREKFEAALQGSNRRQIKTHGDKLLALRERMLDRLRTTTVLDPACGSGNFLYVSLQLLMDMEKTVIFHELFRDLALATPEVHPRQMYGIEKDPIAHALASIVVWIGYIQWRKTNGYAQAFADPILEALTENIVCDDAIMRYGDAGASYEPQWPTVDVIVGNPPFLGGSKIRGELGDTHYEDLTKLYKGRVPGFADLVCYWFERARTEIEAGKTKRAGLLATNSIRGGENREVLKRIKSGGDIFMAWADREWVLEGAAVRVSMVGFDGGNEDVKLLENIPVDYINPDLTATVDVTKAVRLERNRDLGFIGPQKDGPLDIPDQLAREMLRSSNPSGKPNSDVLRPYLNGSDIVRNSRDVWIIDFRSMPKERAAQYEAPFEYVTKYLKPKRANNRDRQRREKWWLMGRSGEDYRKAAARVKRQIFTPRVAKHRIFVWVSTRVFPDSAVVAIAREDDYFFGVLHSKLHEVWSLRMGTWLGKGNDPRYTPTTTFETFPFPWSPGEEDTDSPAHRAISAAAQQLDRERSAWLDMGGKHRTLTNLYNALVAYREQTDRQRDMPGGVKPEAWEFAPRLAELHDTLDRAVCDAYGWPHTILDDEEEILRRLLALNLARAA
jgi:methylase of polypeptide subunit release factors